MTTSANMEASVPVAFRGPRPLTFGHSPLRLDRLGQRLGQVRSAVVQWARAGQLDAGSSVELARWAGSRR